MACPAHRDHIAPAIASDSGERFPGPTVTRTAARGTVRRTAPGAGCFSHLVDLLSVLMGPPPDPGL